MRLDLEASSLPLLRRRAACDRRDCQRDARLVPARLRVHPHPPAALWLPGLRDDPSGAGPGAADRQGPGQPRPARACAGQQVLRPPAALSAEPDLRPARRRDRPLDAGELGRWCLLVAGAAAGAARRACVRISQNLCRRHADPGARSRPRPHQDRPAVGLCARRSALERSRSAGGRLLLQSRSQGRASGRSPRSIPRRSAGRRLCRLRAADRAAATSCWRPAGPTHERKFYDLHEATGSPIAAEALRRIAELYAIEKTIRGRTAEERRTVRNAQISAARRRR